MKNGERAAIYSGLALCLALAIGWRGPGAFAGAQGGLSAVTEPAKTPRIGTIDLRKLVIDQFTYNEGYKSARDLEQAKTKDLEYMLEGMKAKLEKLDQNSPEFKAEVPSYQAKLQDYQQLQQALSVFASKQVARAAAEIAEAAKKVAAAKGYTHVFVSLPLDAEYRSTDPDRMLGEALQRTVLVGEQGTDITELVRAELKIPVPPMTVTPVGPVTPVTPGTQPATPVGPAPSSTPAPTPAPTTTPSTPK